MITGKTNTLDIPVTKEQIIDWQNGALIQDAMPNISEDHREFIMTGILPEVWDNNFL
jgi:hypothetical protein